MCTHKVRLFFSQNTTNKELTMQWKKVTQKIKSLFCSHSLPQYYYEIPPFYVAPHSLTWYPSQEIWSPLSPFQDPLPPLFFVLHIQFFSTFDEKEISCTKLLRWVFRLSYRWQRTVQKILTNYINHLASI